MRARIRARFADLHHKREQLETQLAALAKTTPAPTDPSLLDQIPLLGDILPELPPALKARLFAAFGLEILWNKPGRQVTVFAKITDATLQAIPGLTDPGQDGYRATSPQTSNDASVSIGHLNNTPRCGREGQSLNSRRLRPPAASGPGGVPGATGVTSGSQVALELRGAGEGWLVGLGTSRTATPQARGFPYRRVQGRGELRLFLPEQPAHETLIFPRAVVGHHAAPA